MNRLSSSSTAQKEKFSQPPQPPPPPKKPERNLKRERIPRKPLKDVNSRSNGGGGSGSGGASGSVFGGHLRFFPSYYSSSSSSLEAPFIDGPLKFMTRTPKSAPVAAKPLLKAKPRFLQERTLKPSVSGKPAQKKPQKWERNSTWMNPGESGKRLTSKNTQRSNKKLVLGKLSSGSREVNQKELRTTMKMEDKGAHCSPVSMLGKGSVVGPVNTGKLTEGGVLSDNMSSDAKTPPLQPSVSPEIQCGSSKVLPTSIETPIYYAAEYPLSGVSDKRKRRPIGTLTVVENCSDFGKPKALNSFDYSDGEGFLVRDSGMSMIPLPADASMHWLPSPCDGEENHGKGNSDDVPYLPQQLVGCEWEGLETPSPLSDRSFSSDVCNLSSGRSISVENNGEMRRRSISSLSPNELSQYKGCGHPSFSEDIASAFDITPCGVDPSEQLREERKHRYEFGDKSPFSVDTLGSENVIQTPESNSSSDNHSGPPWPQTEGIKKQDICSDFDSLTMSLQSTSLSPKSRVSSWDPSSSSFHLQALATSSNSTDLSQFQSHLGDRRSCHSNMTLDSISQMHMRISWRDELNSQTHNDEFDSCRCVSDEEENANGSSEDQQIKSLQSSNTGFDVKNDKSGASRSGEFVDKEAASVGKDGELLHPVFPRSASESISTDGSGLIRSEDSDWMAYYKNHSVGV